MDRKELKGSIDNIETFIIENLDRDGSLGGLCREFANEEGKDSEEQVGELLEISLAVGFVLGQLFEVTDPEIQAEVERIKKGLREERILPYLPRERQP